MSPGSGTWSTRANSTHSTWPITAIIRSVVAAPRGSFRRTILIVVEALDVLPTEVRRALRRRSQPDWIDPMLATLTDERFSDPNWIFERKLDGERCLAFRSGRTVRLMSRNRLA